MSILLRLHQRGIVANPHRWKRTTKQSHGFILKRP